MQDALVLVLDASPAGLENCECAKSSSSMRLSATAISTPLYHMYYMMSMGYSKQCITMLDLIKMFTLLNQENKIT